MHRTRSALTLFCLALALSAAPVGADPCADVTDPEAIATEDAVAADTAADPARYREMGRYWSPDFAFNAMIGIEAPADGETAVGLLRAALPRIDMALGLAEAGPAMARGGDAPVITIRLLDGPLDAPDEAWTDCVGRDCAVELFPAFWQTADADALAFTLAHEMFHVAQKLAYPAVDHCNAFWWVEGTAEWFANVAVPGQDLTARAGFLEGWDRDSAGVRLIDLDYSAVGFWFWAAERYGPQFPLTLGAFGNAGLKDVAAVATLLPPEDWPDLVKVHLGGVLAYPDGRSALPAPDLGPDTPPEGETVMLIGPALSIQRRGLVLEPGLWRIRRSAAAPGTVVLVGDEGSAGWSELPEDGSEVTRFFGCDAGGTVTIAAAGGTGAETSARLTVEPVEGAGCETCLVGVWEQTVTRTLGPEEQGLYEGWANVADLAQGFGIFPNAGVAEAMAFTARYQWAGPRLTLSPDGSYVWNDPVALRHQGDGEDGPVSVEEIRRFDGEMGRWRDVEGLMLFDSAGSKRQGVAMIEAGPLSQIVAIDEPYRSRRILIPQGFRAACSGDRLVLEHPVTPSAETTRIFRRVN